jgi:hypothetical protein
MKSGASSVSGGNMLEGTLCLEIMSLVLGLKLIHNLLVRIICIV